MLKQIVLWAAILCIPAIYAQERSQEAKDEFKRIYPCPYNGNTHGPCPGYVIDHIVALACGGADDPSNMQWQSVEDGKAKDAWETRGCRISRARAYTTNNLYYIGRKGGCYTFSASGKKRYVNRWLCH